MCHSIRAFCYMLNLFSVVVFHRSMFKWWLGGYLPWLNVHSAICETFWCSGIPYINGQLGGTSALSICAFGYMLNVFSVVVFHRSMVNWRRGALVYVHSAICETAVV